MHHHPNHLVSNADLLARAARNLPERAADTAALRELLGSAPDTFQKPTYNTPPYVMAPRCGWISAEEEAADRAAWEQRRCTSLQTCHRYSPYERLRAKDSGDYVPELAARLDDDRAPFERSKNVVQMLESSDKLRTKSEK
jgi:hypothetical protein